MIVRLVTVALMVRLPGCPCVLREALCYVCQNKALRSHYANNLMATQSSSPERRNLFGTLVDELCCLANAVSVRVPPAQHRRFEQPFSFVNSE